MFRIVIVFVLFFRLIQPYPHPPPSTFAKRADRQQHYNPTVSPPPKCCAQTQCQATDQGGIGAVGIYQRPSSYHRQNIIKNMTYVTE